MFEYVQKLFGPSGFMPQGHSYFLQSDVLTANVVGDGLTALAYFSIPPVLYFLTRKRKDLIHKNVSILFALFILLAGIVHLVDIINLWVPIHRLHSLLKIIAGLTAIVAAFVLYRSIPVLLRLPGLRRLEAINTMLREEVAERERAQIALRQANEALENRVQQRTAQLIKTNRELEREIEKRKKTDNA